MQRTTGAAALDRDAIEVQIRQAFAGVMLGSGISLRQAQVIDRFDDGVTDADFDALPRAEVTNSWVDVPFDELERDCVAHLDEDGLRYYLPALLLSLLSHYDPASMRVVGTIAALRPHILSTERRFTYLTDEQHRAVADFLTALPRLLDLNKEDLKIVSTMVRDYWGRYATSARI
ncbi:MAG TPA: DUF6714 family protein [Steroidobacteraceae bacterium]|jgi:hypothetical protein